MIDSGEDRSDRGRRTGTRARKEMSHQQGFSPARLRMRRFCAGAGKRMMVCFLPLGLAGSSPSPAEIVSSRFPSASVSVVPASFSTTSVLPVEQWKPSSPKPFFPETTAYAAIPATVEAGAQLAPEQLQQSAAPIATSKPEPSGAQSTHAAARRAASRPGGVLNDAQIASIKQRLNLTPEQEKMWPAVEAALRKIVYTKNAMSPRVPAASTRRRAHGVYRSDQRRRAVAQICRPAANQASQ
jgi:hypothetical protein